MDPSYNNSFGSSQGPITSGDGSAVGGSGFGTGSGAVSSDSSGSRVGGPVSVSSGTGDIILASSGGKKSKKGLIIGILVTAVLIVVGVVCVMSLSTNQSDRKEPVNSEEFPVELVEAYNSFVNYLVLGLDSKVRPDFSEAEFESDGLSLAEDYMYSEPSDERDTYFSTLLEKYEKFAELYSNSEYARPILDDDVRGFFYDIAMLNKLDAIDVASYYDEHGLEQTIEYINTRYKTDSVNENVKLYFDSWREYLKMQLSLYDEMAKIGCVENGALMKMCETQYSQLEAEMDPKMDEYHQSMVNGYGAARAGAYSAMMYLYDYFYPATNNMESQ